MNANDRTGQESPDRQPTRLLTDGGEPENPHDLPDSHPLADYNGVLDDHKSHIEALGEYLHAENADDILSAMLIVTEGESTDTIPTMHSEADFETCVWLQLAAHIGHLASTFEISPERVAKHAVHVLREQQPTTDELRTDGSEDGDSE